MHHCHSNPSPPQLHQEQIYIEVIAQTLDVPLANSDPNMRERLEKTIPYVQVGFPLDLPFHIALATTCEERMVDGGKPRCAAATRTHPHRVYP